MDKVNVREKLTLFHEVWSPKIIGEVNESYVKVVKLKGEFVWHSHANEDELFYVLKGQLIIRLRQKDVILNKCSFCPASGPKTA
jgi:mannose-6-phosphate isomerase-like protein (cupin superfamily)